MTAAIGVGLALALAPLTGTATAQETGTMAVTDMDFTPPTVDATPGGSTVTLRWTMTDTTPETEGMNARVHLRRQGATAGFTWACRWSEPTTWARTARTSPWSPSTPPAPEPRSPCAAPVRRWESRCADRSAGGTLHG